LCLSLIYLRELYTVRGIVRWFYIKQDLPKSVVRFFTKVARSRK